MKVKKEEPSQIIFSLLSHLDTCGNIPDKEARAAFEQMTKNTIIQEHEKKNKIFLHGDVWYTHYETVSGERKTLHRNSREELEKALINKLEKERFGSLTFRSVYPAWIAYKQNETSKGNANKLMWAWKKYFETSTLADMVMTNIKTSTLKEELIKICRHNSLNQIQAKEMKTLVNSMFDFAIENDWMSNNPSRALKNFTSNDRDYIKPMEEKTVEEEVFFEDEETATVQECFKMFQSTNNTIYLGIILNFLLGLRAGELITCKFSDFHFDEKILHLCRSEVRNYSEDGLHRNGFNVNSNLKKHVRYRNVIIGKEVQKLVEMINQTNISNGYPDSEWLFIDKKGNRKNSKAIQTALARVNSHNNTIQKSNHKIRKTVISNLINSSQFSIVEVRDFAGHKDVKTTLKYYGRNTTKPEDSSIVVDAVLGSKINTFTKEPKRTKK